LGGSPRSRLGMSCGHAAEQARRLELDAALACKRFTRREQLCNMFYKGGSRSCALGGSPRSRLGMSCGHAAEQARRLELDAACVLREENSFVNLICVLRLQGLFRMASS